MNDSQFEKDLREFVITSLKELEQKNLEQLIANTTKNIFWKLGIDAAKNEKAHVYYKLLKDTLTTFAAKVIENSKAPKMVETK